MKWFKKNILGKNPLTKKLLGSSKPAKKAADIDANAKANTDTDSDIIPEDNKSSNPSAIPTTATTTASPTAVASVPTSDHGPTSTTRSQNRGVHLGTLWVIACGFEHTIFLVRNPTHVCLSRHHHTP